MSARMEQEAVTIARRLDSRQREILRALFDHELLLTYQLKVLFFSSVRRCQQVLRGLLDEGLVERDYPSQEIGVGKGQSHWTLTELGVRVVAVMLGMPRSQIEWMPRQSFHAADRHLQHLLGINRFFVSLVEASLLHADHGLEKWVTERYVRTRKSWIRHDGFGRYQHPGGACDFYFEYDRVTEWHDQLVNKLRGYVLMAIKWTEDENPKEFVNVLVVVPTEKRETAFDRALKAAVESLDPGERTAINLPFFIASEELLAENGMLGKVWRQFAPPPEKRTLAPYFLSQRLSLLELASRKAGPYDLERCLGKSWTDSGARWKRSRRPSPPTFPSRERPEPWEDGVG